MKHYSLLVALAMASSFVGANSAQAGAEVGSWYVAPKLIYVDPDRIQRYVTTPTQSYKVGDAFGASLSVGKVLNQNWDAEVGYVYSRHSAGSVKPATSFKTWEGVLDRVFMRDKAVNPFVGFGINSTTYSLTTVGATSQAVPHREWGYLVKTGALVDVSAIPVINKIPVINTKGAMQLVAEIGWRADGGLKGCDICVTGTARYLENTFYGLGLHYNFGKRTVAKAAPVVAAVPAAAPVAPAPAPVPAPAPAKPATPPPPPPPVDTDRDGVVDPADRCPATPAGDKVDAVGCSLTMVLEVQFDTAKATIKPESNSKLDQFVQFLKDVPSAKGVLEGHTDNVGSKAANQALSERRAQAVKAYVVSKGIDAARFETKGYGDTKPVADNNTAEGRAANRRVQFTH